MQCDSLAGCSQARVQEAGVGLSLSAMLVSMHEGDVHATEHCQHMHNLLPKFAICVPPLKQLEARYLTSASVLITRRTLISPLSNRTSSSVVKADPSGASASLFETEPTLLL